LRGRRWRRIRRIAEVIRIGWRSKLVAVFPEGRTKEAKRLWKEERAADAQELAERGGDLRGQSRISGIRKAGGGTGF
jgi:hypothetical protein